MKNTLRYHSRKIGKHWGLRAMASSLFLGFILASATSVASDDVKKVDSAVKSGMDETALESLHQSLKNREKELNERLAKLEKQEEAFKSQNQLVTSQVSAYQKEIERLRAENKRLQKKKVEKNVSLSKVYEKMDPKKAAKILDGLNVSLSVQILSDLNPSKAAEILGRMSSQKAKSATEALMRAPASQ